VTAAVPPTHELQENPDAPSHWGEPDVIVELIDLYLNDTSRQMAVMQAAGEFILNNANRKNEEEKKVDKLASHLLLPKSVILSQVKEVPVTASAIKRLAKGAKVSDLVVALRIAATATALGLNNASVVFYEDNEMVWQWSETLKLTMEGSQELLSECINAAPTAARIPHEQDQLIVASLLDNPYLNTKTVFLQLVAESEGTKQLHEERIKELGDYVYGDDNQFRKSLQGCFGTMKPLVQKLSLEDAVQLFDKRYLRGPNRWKVESFKRLKTERGREYIRLRLQAWSRNDS
jgi:hypothetical protein